MGQQQGFTLLEMILVIIVMAMIAVMTLRGYQRYQAKVVVAEIKNDLVQITDGLDLYYSVEGCDSMGNFPQDKASPVVADLVDESISNRPPVIVGYHVLIIPTAEVTQEPYPKKINSFQIRATLNPKLSAAKVEWYRQKLDARAAIGHMLMWTMLPKHAGANCAKI